MLPFKKLPFKIENTWVSSDTHFGHSGIVKGMSNWEDKSGCRDFNSVDEMNKTLIYNFNSLIKENDLLIHHGDWSFGGENNIDNFRNSLICKNIIIIRGNHCQHIHKHSYNFSEILDIGYFQIEEFRFVSCHYPIFHWHQQEKGVAMLHGHLHNEEGYILKQMHNSYKIMDVGVDQYFKLHKEYKPFNIYEVINLLKNKNTLERH